MRHGCHFAKLAFAMGVILAACASVPAGQPDSQSPGIARPVIAFVDSSIGVAVADAGGNIRVLQAPTKALPTAAGDVSRPVWSRDGRYVAFQSDRNGDAGVFRQRFDGAGSVERLTTPEGVRAHVPEDWSPTEDVLAWLDENLTAGDWERLGMVAWFLNEGTREAPKVDRALSILSGSETS